MGANVVDARSYTSKDGFATAAFWIQDGDGSPYNQARFSRLRRMIEKTLSGEVITREAIKERDKFKKREKAFKVPTSITFDNEGSEIYTIIEVDTRDRPGLLFDLTRTLANMNVYIASAVIATYGEQVVDRNRQNLETHTSYIWFFNSWLLDFGQPGLRHGSRNFIIFFDRRRSTSRCFFCCF